MAVIAGFGRRRIDGYVGNDRRARRQQARELQAAIGLQVLERLLRAVLVDRTVLLVVMRDAADMHHRVRRIAAPRERRHLPCEGEALRKEPGGEAKDDD